VSESRRVISCEERDAILGDESEWTVGSTCTDLAGRFGQPYVLTTWERGDERVADERWPGPDGAPDVTPCMHTTWREEPRDV